MHELGSLHSRHASMIAVGGMVGAGLFVGSGAAISAAGPAVVCSYLLAGAIILMIMRMLAEMAVAMPHLRSFSEFIHEGLGARGSFVAGWLYWAFWVMLVPLQALAAAYILGPWIALPSWSLALLLVAIVLGINLLPIHQFGEISFWFSLSKLGALTLVVVICVLHMGGELRHPAVVLAKLNAHGGFSPTGAVATIGTAITAFVGLAGAEIATIAAAESRHPLHEVGRNTSLIVVRVLVFYIVSILLVLSIVPWNGISAGFSPFTLALRLLHTPVTLPLIDAVVLAAVVSTLNSALFVGSRTLYRLAEQGDAPGWLAHLTAGKVPVYSIGASGLFGLLGICAAGWARYPVYSSLVNASGALMAFVYLLIAISQIKVHHRLQSGPRRHLRLKVWLFPWASYATVLVLIGAVVAMACTSALTPGFCCGAGALFVVTIASYGSVPVADGKPRQRPR